MKRLLIGLFAFALCACAAEPEPDPLLETSWVNEEGEVVTIQEGTEYTINEGEDEIEIDGTVYYPDDSDKAKEIQERKEREAKIEELKQKLSGTWTNVNDPATHQTYLLPNTFAISQDWTDYYLGAQWVGTFTIDDDLSLHYNVTLDESSYPEDMDLSNVEKVRTADYIYTDDPAVAMSDEQYWFCDGQNQITARNLRYKAD